MAVVDRPDKKPKRTNAAGTNAQCKACMSPHRVELERQLLAGEPTRAVSTWLSTQGEKIRFDSLANHKKLHMAIAERAREEIEKAEAQLLAEVGKVVATAELLDEAAGMAMKVARSLVGSMVKTPGQGGGRRPGHVDAMLFEAMLRELRQIVKTKHEMKNGKDINIHGLGLIEFIAKYGSGADGDDGGTVIDAGGGRTGEGDPGEGGGEGSPRTLAP